MSGGSGRGQYLTIEGIGRELLERVLHAGECRLGSPGTRIGIRHERTEG